MLIVNVYSAFTYCFFNSLEGNLVLFEGLIEPQGDLGHDVVQLHEDQDGQRQFDDHQQQHKDGVLEELTKYCIIIDRLHFVVELMSIIQ